MTKRETLITIPASIFRRRADVKDTSDEVALAALLSWLVDTHKQGFTETKTEVFATSLGWSKRKTVDVLKRLERNGYITIERQTPMPSRYRLCWSPAQPPPQPHPAPTLTTTPDMQPATQQPNANLQTSVEQRLSKLEKSLEKIKIKVAKFPPAILGVVKAALDLESPNLKQQIIETLAHQTASTTAPILATPTAPVPAKPAAPVPAPAKPLPPTSQKPSKR